VKRLVVVTLAVLAGCTYYVAQPPTYASAPPPAMARFDRSWSAVVGAFGDEGVQVTSEDRNAGIVSGSRGGIDVTANVRAQADGSIRVELNTRGATERDPGLIDRISRAYDRRMGR
jgi:hypothetical protein